jgi:undecaprenyl-diphosphatase
MLLVFAGIFLPLWGFGAMADGVREGQAFAFDLPVLRAVHALASAGLDRVFLAISALGYGWGVLPADALLVLGLALARRLREMAFAGIAIVGSLALDLAVKHAFARTRPSLWESLVHETSYSFPSGHAMASMTLAWVVALLCWSGRFRRGWALRWPATVVAAAFVLLVGVSRLYLGVHYPSDIFAGWTAASIWVVCVHAFTLHGRPGPRAAAPR